MTVAEVKIWDKSVGAVAWDEKTGLASFEYDPKFKKTNWDLAPLKMPIHSAKK
jgi:serine/threonine-protein kinase HipA